MPIVYDELRRRARRMFGRQPAGGSLPPTAVVHETFLRLVDQSRVAFRDRAHFFAVASRVMRHVLVDHARRRRAWRRGGRTVAIPLDEATLAARPFPRRSPAARRRRSRSWHGSTRAAPTWSRCATSAVWTWTRWPRPSRPRCRPSSATGPSPAPGCIGGCAREPRPRPRAPRLPRGPRSEPRAAAGLSRVGLPGRCRPAPRGGSAAQRALPRGRRRLHRRVTGPAFRNRLCSRTGRRGAERRSRKGHRADHRRLGALPAPAGAGPGRHGRRLEGEGPSAGPARGSQVPPRQGRRGSADAGALRARGALGFGGDPPSALHDLRGRGGRRSAVPGHGAPRGHDALHAPLRGPAPSPRAPRRRPSDGRRRAGDPRGRDHPPRSEAGERLPDRRPA